jgi:hypothetical protein
MHCQFYGHNLFSNSYPLFAFTSILQLPSTPPIYF